MTKTSANGCPQSFVIDKRKFQAGKDTYCYLNKVSCSQTEICSLRAAVKC
jgi:hypothetical protein